MSDLMSYGKFFQITEAYNKLTKQELNNRIKRTVRRHIRQTEYFDLIKNGSYDRALSVIIDRSVPTVHAYMSKYEKEGIYKNKFIMIHLAKIAKTFDVGLEYILGIVEVDRPTNTAQAYIDLYELYMRTDKLVVAENVRILKSHEVNGLTTNMDLAKLLGISDNAVKANISTGQKAEKNKFSLEHLYKLANAWGTEIDIFFEKKS